MTGIRVVLAAALIGIFCAIAVPGQPRSVICTALLVGALLLVAL